MIITRWNAFEKFRCVAQDCTDSCCKGWEVDIDEDSARFYRQLDGPLGDRLRQVLKTVEGEACMALEEGRCPMLREDGLCRIHAELGHDALSKVCRDFPRLYQDYGDFQHWGLEMSCPEAARLIFEDPGVQELDCPGGREPDYEQDVMDILRCSQAEAIRILEQGSDLNRDLAVLLIYAHQVQGAIDGGELEELNSEACLTDARRFAGKADVELLRAAFLELEHLTDRWPGMLHQMQLRPVTEALRPLAIYMVRRYWLQAAWDYDLVCRAKLAVAACVTVACVGGEPVRTAQLFSKEIENDPDNVERLLDGAYTSPVLTDAHLLGLLLT